jgi:hypothetical protein
MTALDPEHPNPIEDKPDRELVRNADAYSEIEMSRRLKDSSVNRLPRCWRHRRQRTT